MSVYLVRAGLRAKFEDVAWEYGLASLDFPNVPDLTNYDTKDELRNDLERIYTPDMIRARSLYLGMLWRFKTEIMHGDVVAMPTADDRSIALGLVSGSYSYRPDLPRGCEHTRPVTWLTTILRSQLSERALRSLNIRPTFAKLGQLSGQEITGAIVLRQQSSSSATVKEVAVELQLVKTMLIKSNSDSSEGVRRESSLLQAFKQYLQEQGIAMTRHWILPDGEYQPLLTDGFLNSHNLLLEAKSSCQRSSFRMALGQLLDYRRFLGNPKCAILLPDKPSGGLLTLAKLEHVAVIWQTATGFEATIDL